MKVRFKSIPVAWGLASLAGLFYSVVLPRFPIGFFNDDAHFLLLAKSVLQGTYRSLHLPGQPDNFDALPGYPFFLAPWVSLLGSLSPFLKLTSVILVVGSGLILWKILGDFLERRWKALVLVLFYFHPLTVYLSGALVAEPLFLFFVLAAVWSVCRRNPEDPWSWIVTTGLLVAVVLVRPEGLLLPIAVLVGAGFQRVWREAGVSFAVGVAALLWLSARASAEGAAAVPSYMGLLAHSIDGVLRNLWEIGTRAASLAQLITLEITFPLPLKVGAFYPVGLLVSGVLGFLGLHQMVKGNFLPGKIGAVFTFLYLGLHLLWPVATARYFYVLLPFLGGAVFLGLKRAVKDAWFKVLCMTGVLLCSFLYFGIRAVRAAYSNTVPQTVPRETLRWVSENTPLGAVVLSRAPGVVYLYASRPGLVFLEASDREEFRYKLEKSSVAYVLEGAFPVSLQRSAPTEGRRSFWSERTDWMTSNPTHFPIVFQNPLEATTVFSIQRSSGFQEAYGLYLKAMQEIEGGRLSEAVPLLESALSASPRFGKAAGALGTTLFLLNRDRPRAEALLRQALQWNPDLGYAARNLDRSQQKHTRP